MARLLTAIRLSGYGAAYFFAGGAFMSYWPVWLHERGVQDAEIGTMFMSRQIVSVVSTLSIGWLAHRLGNVRGVLLALGAGAVAMIGAYEFAWGFLAILLVSLAWGSMWSPSMALYDSVLVTETKARGFNYGSLRVWSSVAFILGALAWQRPVATMNSTKVGERRRSGIPKLAWRAPSRRCVSIGNSRANGTSSTTLAAPT